MVVRTSLPAPVTLRGMPAPRFWEMEDALLDLGALQPGGTDLPQLLMIDTVSGYGNDWYVDRPRPADRQPGARPARSWSSTRSASQTLLRPNGDAATASSGGWSMFQLAMPFDEGAPGACR